MSQGRFENIGPGVDCRRGNGGRAAAFYDGLGLQNIIARLFGARLADSVEPQDTFRKGAWAETGARSCQHRHKEEADQNEKSRKLFPASYSLLGLRQVLCLQGQTRPARKCGFDIFHRNLTIRQEVCTPPP